MKNPTPPSDFFIAGGTLKPDTPSYVERPTDDELFDLALAGQFCYVLTPRQMGKSSLMIRTARRLRERGVHAAVVDLTQIGAGVNVEQWYLSLLTQFTRRLKLSTDPVAWWQARAALGDVQRFTDFVRDVVLAEIEGRIVIFIDEIDTTLKLDFRDDFFAAIRAIYNARADDPEFERLTFVLLGVASPPDLIKDRARTPFNIGQSIVLQEFTWEDANVLREGLDAIYPGQGEAIFARIYYWTSGHPYLTQKLCLTIAEIGTGEWPDERVDELVQELFLSEEARKETNLQFVQDKMFSHPRRRELLNLYKQTLKEKAIPDDGQSPMQNHLKLSGLVKVENGILLARNEIYRRAFDLTWVKEHTAVNWTLVAASIAGLVALLAVGFILFEFSVGIRLDGYTADAREPNALPEERLSNLASIFRLWSFLGTGDYDYKARGLFSELSWDEQLALFGDDIDVHNMADSDLVEVIKGLYVTLADVDGAGSTTPLLEAMARALSRLDQIGSSSAEATQLKTEIETWLQGREAFEENRYQEARDKYDSAIVELNDENPATLYERARVLIALSEYAPALNDLDQVMAIARRAPSPPALIMTTTFTSATPSVVSVATRPLTPGTETSPLQAPTVFVSPIQTLPPLPPDVTPTPLTVVTETPAPLPTPIPVSISSNFDGLGQMTSAIRELIYSDPDFVVFLASASDESYPNLRESRLILTPTPTPTLSPVMTIETITQTRPADDMVMVITPSEPPTPEPTATIKPTITPLPFIEGTEFPTGIFENVRGEMRWEFREDGGCRGYSPREGWEVPCIYAVNGNLYTEMKASFSLARQIPSTYFWTYDGNYLTFQVRGVDLNSGHKALLHGQTFIFVLESDAPSTIDKIEFPTGRFVNEDGVRAFEFDQDGIWRFFEDDLEHPALSGKYVSNGNFYTEMTHNDPDYSQVPVTYRWTYDGQNLTFDLWGEDVNDHRESVYNQQTYTRVDE
ncbi:MAG: hypothetical protein GY832_41805 [Chloroflexi bacterium]|nr:hypothetical protein [Chloroflexota bacterium]